MRASLLAVAKSIYYIRLLAMKIVGSPLACMCNVSHTINLEKKTKYNTLVVYYLIKVPVATIMDKVDEKGGDDIKK